MRICLVAICISAAQLSAAAAETARQELSATVSDQPAPRPTGAKIRLRQLDLGADQHVSLIVPDGDGRVVVENEILSSVIRVGTHYNFFEGRIKAWVTYIMPLPVDGLRVQVGALDEVGLGRLYDFPADEGRRYFERTQSVPVGFSCKTPIGILAFSASRVYWRYGPLDVPNETEKSIIDSVGIELNADRDFADIAEGKVHEESSVRFKHAFPDLEGQYRFDKVEADVFWRLPSGRAVDSWRVRTFFGQAYNVDPYLPVREKFALGGAKTLKGYQYREFLGEGVLLFGTEYSFGLPVGFDWRRARLKLKRLSLLAFFEEGRLQNSWFVNPDPWKWSFGVGLKFDGTILGRRDSTIRLYAAQAGEIRNRNPMLYFLIGIN